MNLDNPVHFIRAHVERMLLTIGVLTLVAVGSGCSSGKKSTNNNTIRSSYQLVQILSTYPAHGATNIPLDPVIDITFDQKLDAYSAIPENFEIYADDGAKIGGTKLVSTRFIANPNNPNGDYVSQIRISLQGEYLIPDTRYILTWGTPKEGVENADAYGIMNLYGDMLESNAISFTTGRSYSALRSTEFDIMGVSPGRVLSRGKVFNFDGSLKDLIDRGGSESYLSVAGNPPIRITLNQPIGWIGGIDPVSGILPEIPPTAIEEFPHMMVALFDSETAFDQLFASVLNLDFQAWEDFRTTYSNRLSGSVRTVNGRKTLVFELDSNCGPRVRCTYPDTIGQAVIAIVKGLKSHPAEQKLGGRERYEDFVMTGFIHFSGFEFESPLNFVWDWLPGRGASDL